MDGINLEGFAQAAPEIDKYLQEAAAAYHDTQLAEQFLLRALATDSECLKIYFSLYKFYFYKARLNDAEQMALTGLEVAATQGGFTKNWAELTRASTDWSTVNTPQHFYLFSLKALAFIRLRLGQTQSSQIILNKLRELDPRDTVGGSVIRDLAAGSAKTRATSRHDLAPAGVEG